MPKSKPNFEEVVLLNDDNYCGLYSRKDIINNDDIDDFYWMPCTATGTFLTGVRRDNALNGFYTTRALALLNPPEGYTEEGVSNVSFQNDKIIGYYRNLQNYNITQTKADYDTMIAAGVRYIKIRVDWDFVFPDYPNQTTNSSTSWAVIDDLVNYVKYKTNTVGQPMKVSLQFNVNRDDTKIYDLEGTGLNTGWYGLSKSAKDQYNNYGRIYAGDSHFSLAEITGVSQALDFVQKACIRYNSSQLYTVSIGISEGNKSGYNHLNGTDGSIAAVYDYSYYSIEGFKDAMQTKYTTIAAANDAWNTSFANFDAIVPPNSLPPNSTSASQIFASNLGKDWWYWNYTLVKTFLNQCKYRVDTHTNAKFVVSHESFSDDLAARKMQINVSDAVNYADMLQANFGATSANIDAQFDLDIARSNFLSAKKLGSIFKETLIKSKFGIVNSQQLKDTVISLAKSCIDNQVYDLLFESDNYSAGDFTAMKEAAIWAMEYQQTAIINTNTIASMTYNLGNMLNSASNVRQSWRNIGGAIGVKVAVTQGQSLLISDTEPTVTPLYIVGGLIDYASFDRSINKYIINGIDLLQSMKNAGCNAVHVNVPIQEIWSQTANDRLSGQLGIDKSPDWSWITNRLTEIKASGMDVFLRVNLYYARLYGTDPFSYHNFYWGNDNQEVNEWGYVPESDGGKVQFTLADDAIRAKMANRFKQIVQKCYDILGSKLKWVAPVRSSTDEYGYDHLFRHHLYGSGGEYLGSNAYFATNGYNPKNLPKWRTFLRERYGNDLSKISTAYGTTITDFDAIDLPKIGNAYNDGVGHTFAEANGLYNSTKGVDFYLFRSNLQVIFANELKTALQSINSNILFACESGGFSFNLGILHCSYQINQTWSVFDLVKGYTGVKTHDLQPNEGFDFVFNSSKLIGDETSWFDFPEDIRAFENSYKSALKERMLSSLNLGHQLFLHLDSPQIHSYNGQPYTTWNYAMSVISEVRAELGWNRLSYPSFPSSFNLNLSTALANNGGNGIKEAWEANGGSVSARRKINLIIPEVPASSTLYKSAFTFVQKSNGNPLPSADVGNGYIKVHCPSHGITRTLSNMPSDKNTIVKFEMQILDSADEVIFDNKDNYGGFHPNFSPQVGAESYYRVWTPSFPDYADYQWIRSFYGNFQMFGVFGIANDRGNNHFDAYSKYVIAGTFKLRIKNTGDNQFELRAGGNSVFESPGIADVYTTIPANDTWYEYNLNISGITEFYKLNIYNY